MKRVKRADVLRDGPGSQLIGSVFTVSHHSDWQLPCLRWRSQEPAKRLTSELNATSTQTASFRRSRPVEPVLRDPVFPATSSSHIFRWWREREICKCTLCGGVGEGGRLASPLPAGGEGGGGGGQDCYMSSERLTAHKPHKDTHTTVWIKSKATLKAEEWDDNLSLHLLPCRNQTKPWVGK